MLWTPLPDVAGTSVHVCSSYRKGKHAAESSLHAARGCWHKWKGHMWSLIAWIQWLLWVKPECNTDSCFLNRKGTLQPTVCWITPCTAVSRWESWTSAPVTTPRNNTLCSKMLQNCIFSIAATGVVAPAAPPAHRAHMQKEFLLFAKHPSHYWLSKAPASSTELAIDNTRISESEQSDPGNAAFVSGTCYFTLFIVFQPVELHLNCNRHSGLK